MDARSVRQKVLTLFDSIGGNLSISFWRQVRSPVWELQRFSLSAREVSPAVSISSLMSFSPRLKSVIAFPIERLNAATVSAEDQQNERKDNETLGPPGKLKNPAIPSHFPT
jgi:hypothetical protein